MPPTVTEARPPVQWEIRVDRSELLEAIGLLVRAQRGGAMARLSMDGDELIVARAKTSVRVRAHGEWPSTVGQVDGLVLKELLRRRDGFQQQIVIAGKPGWISFAGYEVMCTWK